MRLCYAKQVPTACKSFHKLNVHDLHSSCHCDGLSEDEDVRSHPAGCHSAKFEAAAALCYPHKITLLSTAADLSKSNCGHDAVSGGGTDAAIARIAGQAQSQGLLQLRIVVI